MISIKHNFIFIHPPKTGGNTIHTALKNIYHETVRIVHTPNASGAGQGVGVQMRPPGIPQGELGQDYSPINKHWEYEKALMQAEMLLGPSVLDVSSIRLISTIRNPWARIASWYTWANRIKPIKDSEGNLTLRRDNHSTNQFLLWYTNKKNFNGSLRRPCSSWWSGREPSYVIAMERFEDDLNGLFEFLGIEPPSSVKKGNLRINSSKWRKEADEVKTPDDRLYRELYMYENGDFCDELIEMIREEHAPDIEYSKKLFDNHKYSCGPVGLTYDF